MIRSALIAAAVLLLIPATTLAAKPLTVQEARNATRMAGQSFAGLMDAKVVDIGGCKRESTMRIRCKATVRGAKQTCRWTSLVRQRGDNVYVSARGMRCTP